MGPASSRQGMASTIKMAALDFRMIPRRGRTLPFFSLEIHSGTNRLIEVSIPKDTRRISMAFRLITKAYMAYFSLPRKRTSTMDSITPRTKGDGQKPRVIEHISLEEIGALVVQILHYAYGIEQDALSRRVIRLLGFARSTPSRMTRVELAIELLLAKGMARSRGESILPAE